VYLWAELNCHSILRRAGLLARLVKRTAPALAIIRIQIVFPNGIVLGRVGLHALAWIGFGVEQRSFVIAVVIAADDTAEVEVAAIVVIVVIEIAPGVVEAGAVVFDIAEQAIIVGLIVYCLGLLQALGA